MKTCPKCGITKERGQFNKKSKAKDGLNPWCKDCHYAHNANYRATRPGRLKAYYELHPEKLVAARFKKARLPSTRFKSLQKRAKTDGIVVEITLSDWLALTASNLCYYCDGPLGDTGSRIDRADNSLGYVLGNCVPCCWICNQMKHTQNFDVWLAKMRTIVEKFTPKAQAASGD